MPPSKIPVPVNTNATSSNKKSDKVVCFAKFRLEVPVLVADPTIRDERLKELVDTCQNLMRRYAKFTLRNGENDAELHAQALKRINETLKKDAPVPVDEQPSSTGVKNNTNNNDDGNGDDGKPVVEHDASAAAITTTTTMPVVNDNNAADPNNSNPADNPANPFPNPETAASTAPPLLAGQVPLPLPVPNPAAVAWPMSFNINHEGRYKACLLLDELTALELDVREGGPVTLRYDPTTDARFPATEDEARDREVPEGMYIYRYFYFLTSRSFTTFGVITWTETLDSRSDVNKLEQENDSVIMSQPQSRPPTGQKGDTDPTWFVRSSRRMAAMQWVNYLTANYPHSAEGRDMSEVLKDMAEKYMSQDEFPHEYGDGCNVRWKKWFVLKFQKMLEELPRTIMDLEMAIDAMERPAPSEQHDGMGLAARGPRLTYNGMRSNRAMAMARGTNAANMNVSNGVHFSNAARASIHTIKAVNVNAHTSNAANVDNSADTGTDLITAAVDKMSLGFLTNPGNDDQLVNHNSASADMNRTNCVNGNSTSMMAWGSLGNNVSNGAGNMNSNNNIVTSKKRPSEALDKGYTNHNALHSRKRVAIMPTNNFGTGMGNNLAKKMSNDAANKISNIGGNFMTYGVPNTFGNNTYGVPLGYAYNVASNAGNPIANDLINNAGFNNIGDNRRSNNIANSPPMNLTGLPTARRLFSGGKSRSHYTAKSDVGGPAPTDGYAGLGAVRKPSPVAPSAQASGTIAAPGMMAAQASASAPAPAPAPTAVSPSVNPARALIVPRAPAAASPDASGSGVGKTQPTEVGAEEMEIGDEGEGSEPSGRT
ncbi:hypothetical protein B0T20DRAFT_397821 [Sordaria brevicollis]|uniref:Uncharacterized protein n=1 Tax=Sordaria brevicollis TaxID=83679 RepID=A0AAE0NV38_SORBR|nr:hypothetical protein B0T20DRAFT_397821 [Sordaria brevicollis]